jgi:DNA-binding FadR family transcriptional regulator
LADRRIAHDGSSTTAEDARLRFWRPARSTTAAGQIVAHIRDALFDGRLKPGDVLGSEKTLINEFKVSRTTVRDALRALETMGIVDIKAGARGGARIAAANPDRFAEALAVQLRLVGVAERDMIDAQLGVEVMAAELAALRATEDDVERLEAVLDRAAALADDAVAFTEASLAFHLGVVEASRNRAIVVQFKALRELIWRAYVPHTTPVVAARVLANHRALLDAIRAGDAAAARAGMSRHLEGLRERAFHGNEPPPKANRKGKR